jgi:hypothetical protein
MYLPSLVIRSHYRTGFMFGDGALRSRQNALTRRPSERLRRCR